MLQSVLHIEAKTISFPASALKFKCDHNLCARDLPGSHTKVWTLNYSVACNELLQESLAVKGKKKGLYDLPETAKT